MPAKRNPEWAWLPKGIYYQQGRIVKRIYEEGKWLRDIFICPASWPKSKVFDAIEKLDEPDLYSLKWLLNKYLESDQFKEKSVHTKEQYRKLSKNLIHVPVKGKNKTLGDAPLSAITRPLIRNYLDKTNPKPYANRHIQFLKAVFNWGMERYSHIKMNPCIGVKLHSVKPRTRYIEDWEFNLVKNSTSLPYIPIFMELAYLCRARWSEVAQIKYSDLSDEGLHLRRTKGSKDEITLWSDGLKSVVSDAKRFNSNRFSQYLIHDKSGLPIRYSGFRSGWDRAMKRALSNGLKEPFTFHDIKAKGVSDHETKESGHRSARMLDVYNRKINKVKPNY